MYFLDTLLLYRSKQAFVLFTAIIYSYCAPRFHPHQPTSCSVLPRCIAFISNLTSESVSGEAVEV